MASEDQKRGRRSRFSAFAKDQGFADVDIAADGPEHATASGAKAERPPRSEVGQLYEVVYKPHVAVRQCPSVEAPVIRCAFYGRKVLLFEWDHTRQWRRITVGRAIDSDEPILEENPSIGGIVECDGWMLVEHPTLGQLLRAVVEEEVPELAVRPEGAGQLPPALAAEVPGGWTRPDEVLAELQRKRELEAQVMAAVEDRPGLNEPRLMRAARAGHYEAVRSLLSDLENPNLVDAMGESALFEAASAGRSDIVGLLLLCLADPMLRSNDGNTARSITTDAATGALMDKWLGADANDRLVRTALFRLNVKDRPRMAVKFGMEDIVLDPFGSSVADEPAPRPEDSKAFQALQAAALGKEDLVQPEAGAVAPAEEPGTPKRTEVPTLYRVVYKMVAVRRAPDTSSPSIRARKLGEVVEMFEWDRTRCWRRVRTTAPRDDEGGSGLAEMDGWMLIQSDKVGVLLQEIPQGEAEGAAEEEDEFAG